MKYLIDRDEMLKLVFDGHGLIGNDLFSIFDPDFDHSIAQRNRMSTRRSRFSSRPARAG